MTNKTEIKNQRVKELKEKIEKLENTLFCIDLIDHWTKEDYELQDKYSKELKELKNLLVQEIVEE